MEGRPIHSEIRPTIRPVDIASSDKALEEAEENAE